MWLVVVWLIIVVSFSVYLVRTDKAERLEAYRKEQRAWLDKPEKHIEDKWDRKRN